MIRAIYDRLEITPEEFALHLREEFEPEESEQLEIILAAAKLQADHFCQNNFTRVDENGLDVLESIPEDVKQAVMKIAATLRESKTDHISGENVAGLSYSTGTINWDAKTMLFPYRKFFAV